MKVISYSLFGEPDSFEFGFYLRGIYFNARMNRILMPGFHTWLYTTEKIYQQYESLWEQLRRIFPEFSIFVESNNPQRCLGMLWRMKPIFDQNVELVFCRDSDSVITYRESQCNHFFIDSPQHFHAINDNVAHGGLMGGMVGFRAKQFRDRTGYTSFNQMVAGLDLRRHGSDQDFLNKTIHPRIKDWLFLHQLKGAGCAAKRIEYSPPSKTYTKDKYWTADLISRYIGSAGVIDFELLRWFQGVDGNEIIDEFEKKFPKICYWR